tara:strand:+ start:19346 stop:19819 length:474 start_codon:yes stop_codon:yes gene_type:complete
VPEADRAIGVVRYVWNDAGEKVWRRLFLSGLFEPCLDPGREEKSRSVLFACCTRGLVGGRNANKLVDDCDIARARDTARLSAPNDASKEYDASLRVDGRAAAGKERFHGATGEVARNGVTIELPPELPPSLFSLKSPECRADRGRSISRPAAAGSRR